MHPFTLMHVDLSDEKNKFDRRVCGNKVHRRPSPPLPTCPRLMLPRGNRCNPKTARHFSLLIFHFCKDTCEACSSFLNAAAEGARAQQQTFRCTCSCAAVDADLLRTRAAPDSTRARARALSSGTCDSAASAQAPETINKERQKERRLQHGSRSVLQRNAKEMAIKNETKQQQQ